MFTYQTYVQRFSRSSNLLKQFNPFHLLYDRANYKIDFYPHFDIEGEKTVSSQLDNVFREDNQELCTATTVKHL